MVENIIAGVKVIWGMILALILLKEDPQQIRLPQLRAA